jgi:hypothetical protein
MFYIHVGWRGERELHYDEPKSDKGKRLAQYVKGKWEPIYEGQYESREKHWEWVKTMAEILDY